MSNNNYQLLKNEALDKKIPIISDDVLAFIKEVCITQKINTVLEIGSAIGYSSICIASFVNHVTTIEKNNELANEATKNIIKFGLINKIKLINNDALMINLREQDYDLLFIDGAKTKYLEFFLKFQSNLKKGGIIICDNLFLNNIPKNNKKVKKMIDKMQKFIDFLKNNEKFITTFYDIGDGISLSVKK